MIDVKYDPDGKVFSLPRPGTVHGLLGRLELRATQVLVIRDGELLTPDRALKRGDQITLRLVTSRG